MAKRRSHHVVPNKSKGGWDVKRGGSNKSIKHFVKKESAIKRGRKISANQKTEFVIHNKDGKIQKTYTHENDLRPLKKQNSMDGIHKLKPPRK